MNDATEIIVAIVLVVITALASHVVTAAVIKDECTTFGKTKIDNTVFVCTKDAK